MGNLTLYSINIGEKVLMFLVFFLALIILIPIARPKHRIKLLGIAFFLGLLENFLYYLMALKINDLSTSAETFRDVLTAPILLIPLIFFLLILLSLAENRRQAVFIALGYTFITFILFAGTKNTSMIFLVVACGAYAILEKKERGLVLLFLLAGALALGLACIGNIKSKGLLLIFLESLGFINLGIVLLIILIILMIRTKVNKKVLVLSILLLLPSFIWIYALKLSGMSVAYGQRKAARNLGYTDLRLYNQCQEQLTSQKELQRIRAVIDRYYQENGVYPPILDSQVCSEYSYWFIWDEVPGKSDKLLLNFLEKNFKINWVKNAGIKKRSDNKSIMVRKGKNLITFQLKENRISAKVSDEPPWTYPAKEKNGKLYIYSCLYPCLNNEFPGFSEAGHRWSNNIVIVHTTPNQKIQPSQITDEGGWIYSSESGDIRINCNHKDSKGVPYYEW